VNPYSLQDYSRKRSRGTYSSKEIRIKIRHIREKTLEDMRRHWNEAGGEGLPSGASWPHQQAARPLGDSSMSFWSILPPPPRMHLSRPLIRFDPRAHVGHVGPARLYKEILAP
jgi:hypothetical protein